MHECGWVHRDISAGNVLLYEAVGKVADVEYAKHKDDQINHGIRTVGSTLHQIYLVPNISLGYLILHGC